MGRVLSWGSAWLSLLLPACVHAASAPTAEERLARLALSAEAPLPPDPTNRYADDARAARLGRRLFFDAGFSGPLLDSANDGQSGTLGKPGDTGRVACASCHVPEGRAFLDTRSPRRQLSLASGWTRRRAPSLLDIAQATFLAWDGSHDTFFSQVFVPIRSPLEFNSSSLFVAQQVAKRYRAPYEGTFGALPALDPYPELSAPDAGCAVMPADPVREACRKPGDDDDRVLRVVVNFGKAVEAYLRRLSCGPGRFDAWVGGDAGALSADEQAGARLFVGRGQCDGCHVGPYLSDQRFHDVGLEGELIPFTGVNTTGDLGAAAGMRLLAGDRLGSAGPFSDGNDGRLARAPALMVSYGFRTPSLRCVSRRPSFMHDGRYRTLADVVGFFARGGGHRRASRASENAPRDLSLLERRQLVAFLGALDGSGPAPDLMLPPATAE